MNPGILAVLLHIGSVIKTIKDVEKGIADVVAGKATPDDAKAVVQDVLDLLTGGLIKLPGLSNDQLTSVVDEIKKLL